ncbi:hypothetical protein [Roseiconus lacunae]|uniref:hypothetical protein n=1 Tax=Roseiconus lacunae TaxID=2605694 RepID=UPI0011F2587C|nr:hypothetical protein [Roseiconus lacunae]
MTRVRWIISLSLVACLSAPVAVWACKIPVFRYALERWPADDYQLVAIVDGDLTGAPKKAFEELQQLENSKANVATEVIDLSTLSEAELWSLEGIDDTGEVPMLQAFYPGQKKLCWKGPLTVQNVRRWIHSPLRTEIVNDLSEGVSVVWLLVEGDDADENLRLKRRLDETLRRAESSVTLPDGVIRRKDASKALAEVPGASMDDVLRCDIPLLVKFNSRVLAKDDPNEIAFNAMIAGIAREQHPPFFVPIFGRGRMIEPLPAAQLDDDAILKACHYLFGECSCSVKALNPGIDILLAADWIETLGDHVVVSDPIENTEPQLITIPPGKTPTKSDETVTCEPSQTHSHGQVQSVRQENKIADRRTSGTHWWVVSGGFVATIAIAFSLSLWKRQ